MRVRNHVLGLATAGVISGLLASTSSAALVWDGGGADQFFGTANNWDLNQSPTSADDIFFPSLGVAPPQTPLWEAANSVNSISVDNSGGFVWQLPRSGSANPRSITIDDGGLTISGGGTTTWGAVATTTGAAQTWNIGNGTTMAFASGATIAGAGKITKTGSGTIQLTASSASFSGGWDINAGLVTNAGGFSTNIYGTGATSVSNAELNLVALGGSSVSGGALTLNNGAILSGRTGVNASGQTGLSQISPSIALSTTSGTSAILKATQSGETFRLASAIAGGTSVADSTIRVQGPGEVHLLNGNTSATAFLGTWKVETGGTLRAENAASLGNRNSTTPAKLELAGGTMRFAGTSSTSTAVSFPNPISVTADSTITLDKVFHPTFGNSVVNASGAIARTLGALTIGEDILTVNVSSVVTGPTTAGAPVRIGGHAITLTGDATFNVVKPGSFDLSYATTSINDGGNGHGYTKDGTGWMTVSSASTYSGPTSVLGGTLFLNNVGALGQTSSLHVASGATASLTSGVWTTKADLSGGGTIALGGGSTMTAQGSEVSPGASPGILSITGNLALDNDGAELSEILIEIDGDDDTAVGVDFDRLAVSGTLSGFADTNLVIDLSDLDFLADLSGDEFVIITAGTLGAGNFANTTFINGTGTVSRVGNTYVVSEVVVVPEPAAVSLLGFGALAMARRRRR